MFKIVWRKSSFLKSYKSSQHYWLVVSTHLKNISKNGKLPPIEVKIKKIETTT